MLNIVEPKSLIKVISGGQTGADQAGLYAARLVGLETGGTAPLNYRTNGGFDYTLRDVYGLAEDSSFGYKPRTIKNVSNSDGTIIIAKNVNSPGCNLTKSAAKAKRKPLLVIPVPDRMLTPTELAANVAQIISFLQANTIHVVNIAGNREHAGHQYPLFQLCVDLLVPAFEKCKVIK